jgi:hypothetical protein
MDIQNVAQAGVPGSTDVKRGQASINIKIDLIKLLSIL